MRPFPLQVWRRDVDGEAPDPVRDGLNGPEVGFTARPAPQIIARLEVNRQSSSSGPIQAQTQEREGHLVDYVDVLPKARPFNGDHPPRATHGHDFEPVPPL